MTSDGTRVGRITQTRGSMAHVEPDSGLSETIRRRLGWAEESADTYELDKSAVDKIAGEEIHLKDDFQVE